jgi:hypothetical protein
MPFDRTVWVHAETGLYESANLFVRRDRFLQVGGFEDWVEADIGRPFGEDVWLGWRLRRAGARTVFAADALVNHAVFSRGPLEYVLDRRRVAYFPRLAARIPELRRSTFFARRFLNARTAAFDAAVAGGAAAILGRSPLPLVAAAPYLWLTARKVHGWRRHAPLVTAADLAADSVGLLSLAWGSIRSRTLLL